MRLHVPVGFKKILRVTRYTALHWKIDVKQYPLREWVDAAQYLSQKDCSFVSREQAKAYILKL